MCSLELYEGDSICNDIALITPPTHALELYTIYGMKYQHYELITKFNVGLKSLLHQGLSKPDFYGDLVYKFKNICGLTDFSDQFRKNIMRYKRIGYNLNVTRQSACLVINAITVDGYCLPVDRATDSILAPKAIHFSWFRPELSSVAWSTGAQLIIFFCFRFSVVLFDRIRDLHPSCSTLYLSSPRLCFFIVI